MCAICYLDNSLTSLRSANYCDSSRSGVMFLTKVVLGSVHYVTHFAEVNSCPGGKQSVSLIFILSGGDNNVGCI